MSADVSAMDDRPNATAFYYPDIDVAVATTIDQPLDDETHGAGSNRRKHLDSISECIADALEHERGNPR